MPIYSYVCNKCGYLFDLERKIAERNNLASCPKCGSSECEREVTKASFILKGTGWYVTDYKNKR